jgi:Ni,Fe-hydrogenase III component G
MGVIPKGHPDLRRLLLHEDWPEDVYPLRKDWKPPRSLESPDE